MKNRYKIAYCATCGMKLIGKNLSHIGDKYYCRADYDKQIEIPRNKIIERDIEEIKKLFGE